MVDRDRQQRALAYLNRQVFATPEWLLEADVLDRFQGTGAVELVRTRQTQALNQVLNVARMKRLVEQEAFHGSDAYSLGEMLDDLRAGVWSELASGQATDAYRRNLQRAWLARMSELMEDEEAMQSDVVPFARGTAWFPPRRACGRLRRHVAPCHAAALRGRDRADRRGARPGELVPRPGPVPVGGSGPFGSRAPRLVAEPMIYRPEHRIWRARSPQDGCTLQRKWQGTGLKGCIR